MTMKTVFNNPSRFLVLCFFLSVPLMNAQTLERNITKNFPLTPNGEIVIDNAYGTIKLNSWDKDEVLIEVIIKVKSKNEESAEEVLENINVEFDVTKNSIRATTLLPDRNRSWWKNWTLFGSTQLDYSINYLVQMPKTAQLNIDNEYGNIYLDETDGTTQLNCAYGRIDIGRLNHPNNTIEISYAPSSEIDFVNAATIEADYSGLSIAEAGQISYEADYTKSSFALVESLNFEADYGSLSIEEANVVSGEADYLTIKIGSINNSLDLNMDYGSIRVERIEASSKKIEINADYAGIKLGADPDWDFAFTVETEYAGFKSNFPLDYKKKIIESTERFYQGQYGNGNNQLNLKAEYGSIKLIQN